MRQAFATLPVYTGDVSGVCSALFELGGMVVIHDPSGCNSTYNTHDEVRWYDHDSLIFISGLTDVDAVMGNDDKFVADVVEAAEQTRPRFVALANSPIPYQLGTDFAALARQIEARCGLPTFHVPTNATHDYVRGAGLAFEAVAERLVREPARRGVGKGKRVNVLGMTPLDFAAPGSREALDAWIDGQGYELVSCWAMGSTFDDVMRAGEADLNLVVSATGLRAARVLRRRFGTPYSIGYSPLQKGVAPLQKGYSPLQKGYSLLCGGGVALVGEPVTMGSLAAALRERGVSAHVVCPLEDCEELLGPGDVMARGEEELTRALAGAQVVVGDPFYRPLAPEGARFVRLPHLAFSGRQWLDEIPVLFGLDVAALMEQDEGEGTTWV